MNLIKHTTNVPAEPTGDLGDMPEQFGRYRLIRMLGKGGMGAVYLGHDTQLDRKVAIKVPKFSDDPDHAHEAIERFYREARAMATVEHPNLCPIHDVGEIEGHHYLTMAYVEGHELTDEIIPNQPMSVAKAAQIVRTLSLALQVAHENGIVHRDLKPANVMINKRHEPVIMDFGLAQRSQHNEVTLTHSGAVLGSPAYMSPEQVEAHHDKIGPRTDVYALGVILYQMLCGRRPFEGSAMSVLGKIAAGIAPTRPSELANVYLTLEQICLKAMSPQIEDRYESELKLAEALEPFTDESQATPVPVDHSAETMVTEPSAELETSKASASGTEPMDVSAQTSTFFRRKLIVAVSIVAAVLIAGFVIRKFLTRGPDQVVENTSGDASKESDGAQGKVVVSKGSIDSSTTGPVKKSVPEALLPRPPVPTVESTGEFVDSGQDFGTLYAYACVAGDADNDGDVDVITVSDTKDKPNQVWLNDGDARFEIKQEIPSATSAGVGLGDLDADSDLDLVIGNYSLSLRTTGLRIEFG